MKTNTSLYEYVMHQLRSRRFTQRDVARGSGVPFSTVAKIAQGSVREPSVHTVQAMADFFMANRQPDVPPPSFPDEAAHDERDITPQIMQEAA